MTSRRIAIIGTGKSVDNHLTAMKELGDRAELVAAVDVDEARVRQIALENNIPHWFTSTEAMLDAVRPDIVSIITPPATHKQIAIDCLHAGAWVLCEKPLVTSLAEFDEIDRAEQATGRYLSTVFQWRFGSAVKHLKHLITSGALGRPLVGVCNTMWYRDAEYYRAPWRGRYETEVGGPTATLGIHLLDLFLWLYGSWSEVTANIATLDREIDVEDIAMAIVRFENGALGSVVNSVLSPRQESYLRLDFQRATAEVNTLYRYNNDNWRFTAAVGEDSDTVLQNLKSIPENVPGNHAAQMRDVLDSFDRNERPPVSGESSRATLELIASLYKSAHTRQPVARGSITADDPFYYAMNGTESRLASVE